MINSSPKRTSAIVASTGRMKARAINPKAMTSTSIIPLTYIHPSRKGN
jgi:hypothetical protein